MGFRHRKREADFGDLMQNFIADLVQADEGADLPLKGGTTPKYNHLDKSGSGYYPSMETG